MVSDIIVTARRRSDDAFWAYPLEQRADFSDSPMLVPSGEGGGEPSPLITAPLAVECDSAAGLARTVGDELRYLGPGGNTLPPVEFGAGIIRQQSGRVSLYKDNLVSLGANALSTLFLPSGGEAANVLGWVHNHPTYGYDPNLDLEARYPSAGDWSEAQRVVNERGIPASISLFIVDSTGTVREFNYQDRANFQSLTSADKRRGELLPPQITTRNCQPKS